VEFFFFASLMFLTVVVFAVMSLFYKYANGSVVTAREANDADDLHLTAVAETVTSDPQMKAATEQH